MAIWAIGSSNRPKKAPRGAEHYLEEVANLSEKSIRARLAGADDKSSDEFLLYASRLLMAAFWASAVMTWLWALPGLSFGLNSQDYNSQVTAVLVLCSASFITGGGALILRGHVRHTDEGLRRLAFYDGVTGLANRALFLDRLEHALPQARRRGELIALLFIDLDQFKQINDRSGHAAGDRALAQVAERFSRCIRAGDTVARFGGDEFTILLENVGELSKATEVAERTLIELREPIRFDGHEATISASIGIAVTNGASIAAADLLSYADAALYEAKSRGKGQYVVFENGTCAVAGSGPSAA